MSGIRIRTPSGRPAEHYYRPAMGLLLTTTAGLVVWIVLWAIGVKSFDAFLITMLMILLAATARVFASVLPGSRRE
jgi:hypothetical protein